MSSDRSSEFHHTSVTFPNTNSAQPHFSPLHLITDFSSSTTISHPELQTTLKMTSFNLLKRSNDAIHANGDHMVNGATSDIAITTHGSDWYWVSKDLTSTASIHLRLIIARLSVLSWPFLPSSSLASRSPSLAPTASSTILPLPLPWSPVSPISPWAPTWERLALGPSLYAATPRLLVPSVRSFTFATSTGEPQYMATHNSKANAGQGSSLRRCCSWISSLPLVYHGPLFSIPS